MSRQCGVTSTLLGLASPTLFPLHGSLASAASPKTVPLCFVDGGDYQITYDASVEHGVIVLDIDTSGWPYSPATYTGYGFNVQEGKPQIIGTGVPFSVAVEPRTC
jgi:hypothetical protein